MAVVALAGSARSSSANGQASAVGQNDTGPLPKKDVNVFPGDFGGVETPMAFADGRLFVPWVNFATRQSASGQHPS